MRKKLSVTLSAVCVSACALMAPASVQGMRNNSMAHLFSGILQQWQRNHSSEIGKAFHEAACNEDFERMTAIVSSARSQGKDIAEEVMGFYRQKLCLYTFLHECRNPELVWFAVENGMRELINDHTFFKSTPLMTAHNGAVAQALIDNGADVDYVGHIGITSLFVVHNAEVAQALIDNGADVHHVNNFGQTPLFMVETGDIAQVLIASGANVNHTDNSGRTPIMLASNPQVAQVLIDNGANIDELSSNRFMSRRDIEQLFRDNAR